MRPTTDHLLARARDATDMLRRCELCERRCAVDRIAGEPAPCGLGASSRCFKRHLSYAEEIDLIPSYMVYLAGCNFRCEFCVQAPTCFDPLRGELVHPGTLANECLRQVDAGATTINLLGGEPSIHLHTILELAAAAPRHLPLILNSNFYMTPPVLDLLEGVVDIYLADFKFGNDACASRIATVDRYVEVVTRNLLHAARQRESGARLIVRHLLMPGHLECCFRPVAAWMDAHLPDVPFHVMEGYVPAWRAATSRRSPELARTLDRADRAAARGVMVQLGVSARRGACA
ncbi:MAG: radical SAM protein [Planctomycetota bacterium]|nr:radical SAM protein [Planctomycetota bacterium]